MHTIGKGILEYGYGTVMKMHAEANQSTEEVKHIYTVYL